MAKLVIINKGAVNAAMRELGCAQPSGTLCYPDVLDCPGCRERAEKAVHAAIQEIFPGAAIRTTG